jgi:hypothetical protein
MARQLAFELTRADASSRYAIRLVDDKQIADLARAEGFAKPIRLEPVVVIYDEGGDELVPIDGFDDTTPRGRIAMRILGDVYCDALNRIKALAPESRENATQVEISIFRI